MWVIQYARPMHSFTVRSWRTRDGTGSPGHGSAILAGWVGSRVSVSDTVFDPVLSFNMRVYCGVVSTE